MEGIRSIKPWSVPQRALALLRGGKDLGFLCEDLVSALNPLIDVEVTSFFPKRCEKHKLFCFPQVNCLKRDQRYLT